MSERFERGLELLQRIHQEGGERTLAAFGDVAPDLGKYIVEFAYGDIYSRPGLDLKQRQLLTIACLVTQGDCAAELSVHINTGLNVGLSQAEILESMLHCIPYVGFPRVMNAVATAKTVFDASAAEVSTGEE